MAAPTQTSSSGAGSTTSATAAPVDYRLLLLQPEDMVLPNQGYSAPEPATLNPDGITGAEVLLTGDDASSAVGITIVILDSAAAAPAELATAISSIKTVVPSGPPTPAPVGEEAVTLTGPTPDGSKSATALMFRYDRALVRIDFYGLPGTVTPPSTVIDIGQKQTIALRAGFAVLQHH
ncbi:hypothetical protein MMUR_49940 [Mycolicibacterium murale]|uniref:Lipoprotein LpqN n=1 Tax=Mycolicibacterium murale TaxID=182220 RepID=A0A7I9WU32_9MYCO|nr:hypothetical protein [Mycolicibacterium murale]MCV7186613.1 hypothetical protein [Mycolicibacterium murale]GFG60858.1 hypothetical protein MMUR_49940 [Mycolicibacterium murale]